MKQLMISGPWQETSYTAITLNLVSKHYSSREESLPIPLKYIYVSRTAHTNLDVKQTRKQLTSRPDLLWPALWDEKAKNAKLKEKQKWSNAKLHLDDARKLRGIYIIDPEEEFKDTIKNARKKLENISRSCYAL